MLQARRDSSEIQMDFRKEHLVWWPPGSAYSVLEPEKERGRAPPRETSA